MSKQQIQRDLTYQHLVGEATGKRGYRRGFMLGCSRCSLVHDKRGYRPHNVICIRGDRREVRAALRYIERHSHGLIVEAPAEVFVKLFCNGGHRKVADEVWASILQERMLRAAGVKDE